MRVWVISGFGTQIYANSCFKKLINEITQLSSASSSATVLSVLDTGGSSRVHVSPFWAFFSSASSSSPALSVSCEQRELRLVPSQQIINTRQTPSAGETSALSPLPPPHWNPSFLPSLPQICPVLSSPSCAPPPPQIHPLWCSRSFSEWWRPVRKQISSSYNSSTLPTKTFFQPS